MKCSDLAERIQRVRPEADLREVARLCLLLSNATDDVDQYSDDQLLNDAWQRLEFQVQAGTDQHAGMTEELELLAQCHPRDFSSQQVWTLIRAINVQSQMLRMYVGEPEPSC